MAENRKELNEEELEDVNGGKLFKTVEDLVQENQDKSDEYLISKYQQIYGSIFNKKLEEAIRQILVSRGYKVDGKDVSKEVMIKF